MRDYGRALADENKALELNPNYAAAYVNRGIIYYQQQRDWDRVIAENTRAIELDPNDARAYGWRAHAFSAKKDYDRAIADYTKGD